MAMPPPIVPAPTMPTVAMEAAGVSLEIPGTRDTPRSAKKMWISALHCSDRTQSKKIPRSRTHPSSNGSVTDASIASTTARGASI
jgi:hypothetical protein